MKRNLFSFGVTIITPWALLVACAVSHALAGPLDDLATPHDGRSRRETSTAWSPNRVYERFPCFDRRLAFSKDASAFCL
jgi:hypothetical protein